MFFPLRCRGRQTSFFSVEMLNKLSTPRLLLLLPRRLCMHMRSNPFRTPRRQGDGVNVFLRQNWKKKKTWHFGQNRWLRFFFLIIYFSPPYKLSLSAVDSTLSSGGNVDFLHLPDTQPVRPGRIDWCYTYRKPAAAEWVGFQNILPGDL